MVGTLYYVEEVKYKAEKALIAAKFNGLSLKTAKFDAQKDVKKPGFYEKNPTGKVPFLETPYGCISNSNAVARYVARCRADTGLCGDSFLEETDVDQWLDFGYEVETPLMTWLYPVLGLMENQPAAASAAQEDVKKALAAMETHLAQSAFLAAEKVTLADIVLVCILKEGFLRLFDPAFRKPFPKLCQWFQKCCSMSQFKTVLGELQLCEKMQGPSAVAPKKAKETKEEPKKAEPKEAKKAEPKKEAKKAEPKAEPKAQPAAGGASDAEVKAAGDAVRALKEKLKADGLSGKQVNTHPEVLKLVEQLNALKSGAAAPAAPAAAPKAAAVSEADVKAAGDAVRALKEKLKAEGLSGKQINEHAEVKQLVEKLNSLKSSLA